MAEKKNGLSRMMLCLMGQQLEDRYETQYRRKADSRERPKYGQRAETWQLLSERDNNYDTN